MAGEKRVAEELVTLFEESEKELMDLWVRKVNQLRVMKGLSPEERDREFKNIYRASLKAFRDGDYSEVERYANKIAKRGALEGISVDEILLSFLKLRDVRMRKIFIRYQGDLPRLLDALDYFEKVSNRMFSIVVSAIIREREEIIQEQQCAMLELSTPVLQLWDEALVLPLIGVIDSERAARIVEELLGKIVETGASVVVMDMTGVPVIDTAVANHILKTVQAAKLLGAETIITGISPANAQTIVTLGIDLSMIHTRRTLREGIKLMYEMLGLEFKKRGEQ
ncbi:MAG TPA: STAS domain-containing protein [Candidatus Syntrophoarchaeum butanivorans]|uniref:Anti-anti-sigma regulatory factor (Antagonist of anti-sigma factor) n=1 Tax=Candidatus Syntropharchaeum butanivorans TaxID=1839936 RepID=A0A1F2P6H9_9EURY|nr:MAG: anti-anti-sigma regulatory factor (antagonist of anti-sigma factor) [Candidatus Syntrophoarchaeum butanivorans]HEC57438.1 STAS domain-containing protein [Candidatus Syntrophoarchaeum butanivorans]